MPRATTSGAAVERKRSETVTLGALFIAFLKVSLCGFGGGIVWARRIAVENRRWISEQDFADIVSLCQFMPGPNIVGLAVCIGAKTRGAIGTIAAISGFLIIPWGVGLSLGVLYLKYTHLAVLRNVLGGVAATAAGLLIAIGIRLMIPHRTRPAALLFAALAFGLMAFTRLPLLVILFSLVPLSIAVAGFENARAR
jgi:chromate transporter